MLDKIRRLWDHIQWADRRILDAIQNDGAATGPGDATAGPGEAATGPGEAATGPGEAATGPDGAAAGPGDASDGSDPLRAAGSDPLNVPDAAEYTDIRREFAHILGSEENWLARLQRRTPRAPVWPDVSPEELEKLVVDVHRGYGEYLSTMSEGDLNQTVAYTNSAGDEYTNEVGDILLHVALHGQYHRGKINLMLRLSGRRPAPTDYIAFVRGAPAATTA